MQAVSKEFPQERGRSYLRALLDNTPVVLVDINKDYIITYVDGNDVNLARSQLLGVHIREMLAHDPFACIKAVDDAFEGRETTIPNCFFLNNYYQVKFIPYQENGQTSVLGIAINITERMSSAIKFQAIFHSNLLGVSIARTSGEILEANDAYLKIIGALSVRDLRWDSITPPEYAAQSTLITAQLKERGYSDIFEKEYLRPNGTRATVLCSITKLPESDTNVAVFLDITDRKVMENRLRQNIQDNEFFVASLSHDLKNPVAAINLGASLIKRYGGADERIVRLVDSINRDCSVVINLVDSMMEMAKLETGTFVVAPESAACEPLVKHSLEQLRLIVESAGQNLIVDLPPDCPKVRCDQARVARVFSNLIGNAIKYNAKGGSIRVSADVHPNEVEFTIGDEGSGIPSYQHHLIFTRFYQVDHRRTGAGLGLAIVKGIVEAHQGKVWVSDGAPRGAVFHFTLPRADIRTVTT